MVREVESGKSEVVVAPKDGFIKRVSKKFIKFVVLPISIATIGLIIYAGWLYYESPIRFNAVISLYLGEDIANSINYPTINTFVSEGISGQERESLVSALESINFNGRDRYEFVDDIEDADIIVDYTLREENQLPSDSLIVPVGHQYWVRESATTPQIEKGGFLAREADRPLFEALYGDLEIEYVPDLMVLLEEDESRIAMIPFADLNPDLKLLTLDGEYFLDSLSSGGIAYGIDVEVVNDDVNNIESGFLNHLEGMDKSASALSDEDVLKFNMTGVTALSRNLAIKIERSGNNAYASEKIAPFLADADLTHTSNEVSFVPGCVPTQSMSFCSHPKYLETFIESGIDIVELTGNHNNDYGAQYSKSTIDTYKENDMDHFGGGKDDKDAEAILYKEVDGTKIGLVGYNYYNTFVGSGELATPNRSGANSYSIEKVKRDSALAKEAGAFLIVTVQFQECYSYPTGDVIYPPCYKPIPNPDQAGVFRAIVDAGADMVVGTQAHQPQTYEIYKGKHIYYGLGNIFFDQIPWIGTRQGIVLTHYFVGGEHVQTKLTTTLYGNDMQTYVSVGRDRELLLDLLKQAR